MYKTFNKANELIEWIQNLKRFSRKKSLDKMKHLCKLFNNPEKHFPSIHVTGTNGKGSVVSYLKNVFMENGLIVATFTSPYIVKFNERIMINNDMISDEDILRIGNAIIEKFDQIESEGYEIPTFFEFITLMAFIYFGEHKELDLAIIEVGIGGALDSTNVIMPIISVISNIGMDHMNVLGSTLEEILINKLGIVKNDIPAVIGIKDEQLKNVCLNYKQLHNLSGNFNFPLLTTYPQHQCSLEKTTFILPKYGEIELQLLGIHQIENAMIAIKTIEVFNSLNFRNHLNEKIVISNVILKRGLKKTTWPGRLEIVSHNPLIVIDGGHNSDCINRIMDFVKTLPYESKRCIFSCSSDKDKEMMLSLIEPYFDEIILTAFTYKRHSEIEELNRLCSHSNKKIINNVNDAVEYVKQNPLSFNLFIGSLYFISEIRPLLK